MKNSTTEDKEKNPTRHKARHEEVTDCAPF
jgi:hypothetical protein